MRVVVVKTGVGAANGTGMSTFLTNGCAISTALGTSRQASLQGPPLRNNRPASCRPMPRCSRTYATNQPQVRRSFLLVILRG